MSPGELFATRSERYQRYANDVHSAVKDKRYEHIHAVNDKRFFKKLSTTRVSFMGAMGYTGFALKRCFISGPVEVGAASELSLAL